MINSNNLVTLSGGLTRDPEFNESYGRMTFSVAVDNAGREDGETGTGYFDVTVWTNSNKYSPAAVGEYVVDQFNKNFLAKGSRVSVVGRLNQDRYMKDGSKQYRVSIIAENVTVLWSQKQKENRANNSSSNGSAASNDTPSDTNEYVSEPF